MNPESDLHKSVIWATRGRLWGFRFLLRGGLPDPLLDYEDVVEDLGDEPSAWCRVGDRIAFRIPDPQDRRDSAGRVIPHEFVVSGKLASGVESVEEGLREIWPLVADAYARVWDSAEPPTAADLRFDFT